MRLDAFDIKILLLLDLTKGKHTTTYFAKQLLPTNPTRTALQNMDTKVRSRLLKFWKYGIMDVDNSKDHSTFCLNENVFVLTDNKFNLEGEEYRIPVVVIKQGEDYMMYGCVENGG